MPHSEQSEISRQRYGPLVVFFGFIALFAWRGSLLWGWLLFFVLISLICVFHLSLAEVEASPEGIRYRRLFDSGTINFNEVEECGYSRIRPEIGYIRLGHFLSPCGKLYFVLDEPNANGSALLQFIRQNIL
jgi:hypothetical protein